MTEARDVSNHLLFEVATEVANRGTCPQLISNL